jgi:hypothetical protein
MLAGCTGLRIEKIRFICAEANNKEPGSTERGYISQFSYGIHFSMLHFGPPNIRQSILTRGEHFATLTDEGYVMVRVMPCCIPALLRIYKRIKMTVQPGREHRTC